jgi:hypothetical protein
MSTTTRMTTLLADGVLIAVATARGAWAAQSPAQKCQKGKNKLVGRYAMCCAESRGG